LWKTGLALWKKRAGFSVGRREGKVGTSAFLYTSGFRVCLQSPRVAAALAHGPVLAGVSYPTRGSLIIIETRYGVRQVFFSSSFFSHFFLFKKRKKERKESN